MFKLLAYFAFAFCFNLVCTTNGAQTDQQHSLYRHNVHSQHHNQQRIQHHFNPICKYSMGIWKQIKNLIQFRHENGFIKVTINKKKTNKDIHGIMPCIAFVQNQSRNKVFAYSHKISHILFLAVMTAECSCRKANKIFV